MREGVPAGVHLHVCVSVCAHACVCVREGVYACAHACVRVRLHVCVCLHVHWVLALDGLISGLDYGRYFPTLVPDTLFSAGGCGAVFYTHETMTFVHVMARVNRLPFACSLFMDALWACRVAAHRTRQGSHVKRARCTAISLSLSVCPPVCLSIIAGSLPPQSL